MKFVQYSTYFVADEDFPQFGPTGSSSLADVRAPSLCSHRHRPPDKTKDDASHRAAPTIEEEPVLPNAADSGWSYSLRTWNTRFIRLFAAVAIAGVAAIAVAAPRQETLERFEFKQAHMAVDFRIVMYATDQATATQAADAAFARIKQIDRIMSDYDPASELCRLSDTAPTAKGVPVSDDLWRILVRAQAKSKTTDGAFDVTVGPLTRLWRRARRTGKLPPADDLAAAREAVGYKNIEMGAQHHTVRLLKPNMSLDLGAIAKGYAADAAIAVLRDKGIRRALVAGSGDISVGDPPPGKSGWLIAVAPLDAEGPASRHLLVSNVGVSTSGDELQHVLIDGKRYSHVVNPHTGMALSDHISSTIIGPNCTTTDGMGTAISVMGPHAGIELIDRLPGTAAFVARQEGDKVATYSSRRFHDFEVPEEPRTK